MTAEEYFYFEWLIIEKQMTPELYSILSEKEIYDLIDKYRRFKKQLKY
jgi:hypothetical protein